uniref:Ig-like domain-containing protein n=1 Tax=Varanus komodoensis TaxID=61221 RepID=A0A8D2L915_VARKO
MFLQLHLMILFQFFIIPDGFTAFLRSEKEESAIEGKSTTVRCTYDINRYRFSKKYWCRGSSRTSCDVLGDTEKFVKWNYKNKLSLWDFRRGIFVVTMKQLTTDDSGTYWCGIDRPFDKMEKGNLYTTFGPFGRGKTDDISAVNNGTSGEQSLSLE